MPTDYERGYTRALQFLDFAPHDQDFYSIEFRKKLLAYFGEYRSHPRFAVWMADHLGDRVGHALRHVLPWVERNAGAVEGKTVLEMGCGTGSSTVALAWHGANVIACDIHGPSLEVARQRVLEDGCAARVTFLQTDPLLETLDVPGVDFVFCYAVFEHMLPEERAACFEQMWQKLKPGGHLVIYETPNRFWPFDHHTTQLYFWPWLPPRLALSYGKMRGKFPADATLSTLYRQGYGMSCRDLFALLSGKSYAFVGATGRERLLKRLASKALMLLLRRPRWALFRNLDCILRKG
jgi:2-polyprenyl-3-methyl-5-hydroxy-6-metoxy-1,4-benzoquinol methylase